MGNWSKDVNISIFGSKSVEMAITLAGMLSENWFCKEI